jgi:hypothetical protein
MGGEGSGKMDSIASVRLDGVAIHKDGSLSRTKLFEYLDIDLDDYSDIELTPQEATRFMNHVRRMKTGLSAFMPKLCPGPHVCQLGSRCPFEKRYPLSRPCPLETNYIRAQTKAYVEEIGVDPGSPYEMALINSLVELDVFDYRSNLALANDQEDGAKLLMTTQIRREDEVMEMTVPHPILDVKDRIHRRRMNILEAFVITRKEKYKEAASMKKKGTEGSSNMQAEMRELLTKISKAKSVTSFEKIIDDAQKIDQSPIVEADWEVPE